MTASPPRSLSLIPNSLRFLRGATAFGRLPWPDAGLAAAGLVAIALAAPLISGGKAFAQDSNAVAPAAADGAKPAEKSGEGARGGKPGTQANPDGSSEGQADGAAGAPAEKPGSAGAANQPDGFSNLDASPAPGSAAQGSLQTNPQSPPQATPETRPQPDSTPGPISGPVSGEDAGKMQRPGAKDASPAGGITLMERMGIPLPDLPPEKPYNGKVDPAYGAFQRGLFGTAFDYALPKAEKGDPASQTLIAELMTRGLAVKRDLKGAAFWYAKAAAGGDPAAMFKYGLMLLEGRYVTPDRKLADDYMRRAAEAGNASAEFNWAQLLVSENPGKKGLLLALPFYERSADQGIADAQYAVAQIYRKVADVPAEKRQLAREYLVRAARAGFDTAQLDIGIWLINGIAGPQDLEQGFKWLRIAANRGNVAAQNRLSHAYVGALGTRPDPVEAAKWYVLSRRAGLTDPALEDFYLGLPDSQQKQAIDAANKYRTGQRKLGRSPPRVGNAGKPAPVGGSAEQTGAGGEQKIVAKPDEPPADPTALPGVTVPPPGTQPQAPQGDDEDPG